MKTKVNNTTGKLAMEIYNALAYVYSGHESPGTPRAGCSLTFQKSGSVECTMVGLGKHAEIPGDTRYIPDAMNGTIDYDDNLAAICIENGERHRHKIEPGDSVYLTTPD